MTFDPRPRFGLGIEATVLTLEYAQKSSLSILQSDPCVFM